MPILQDARRLEVIDRVCGQLVAWNLREPAVVFLSMHAPLAFLGSQFLIAAQPFLGVVTGDEFARDFAVLLQDPESLDLVITRLEQTNPSASET
ncbi:MAG: hypothetical protein IT331_16425 [Anaerolineae bacterium]|nr:hypothetical protein [Anaerolineae bacterium]